jgi:hypothetical protein
MINLYITGEMLSRALINAGIETTPETSLSFKFNDAAEELTRYINLRLIQDLKESIRNAEGRVHEYDLKKWQQKP